MSGKFALVAASVLAGAPVACSAEPAPPAAKSAAPQFPTALRGCWELIEPPSDEFPDGLSGTLVIEADRLIAEDKGVTRRVGTIERLDRMTPKLIHGLISAPEDGGLATVATELQLDPEGAPAGTLLLREGDAGSYDYRRCSAAKAAERKRYSLVIATTARQDDPRPAPCGPTGRCNDFLYRAEWHDSRVLAGADLPKAFDARLTLHTPYISTYRLALIVERQKDGSLLVRRTAGFNGRTGVACFYRDDEWPVDWKPEPMVSVRYQHGDLCVVDESQIDPNAPKEGAARVGPATLERDA